MQVVISSILFSLSVFSARRLIDVICRCSLSLSSLPLHCCDDVMLLLLLHLASIRFSFSLRLCPLLSNSTASWKCALLQCCRQSQMLRRHGNRIETKKERRNRGNSRREGGCWNEVVVVFLWCATKPEDIEEEPKRRRELNELTEGAAVALCELCEVSPSQLKRENSTGKLKIKILSIV